MIYNDQLDIILAITKSVTKNILNGIDGVTEETINSFKELEEENAVTDEWFLTRITSPFLLSLWAITTGMENTARLRIIIIVLEFAKWFGDNHDYSR